MSTLSKERSSDLLKVDSEFSLLVDQLQLSYPSVDLKKPVHLSVTAYKDFCSGILEGKQHAWGEALSQCPTTVRWSIGASLFLFRKRLPSSPDPENVNKFLDKVSSPAPPLSYDFYDFVHKEVKRLFKPGWDRGYDKKCTSGVLSTSACLSAGRKKGGARSTDISYHRYSEMVRGDRPVPYDPTVRVSSVNDGGKQRIVTIGGKERGVLKPLHSLLYDHLSRKDWLLRGDATPRRFKEFTLKKGEVFVSGDYESATDNLSLEGYEFILQEVLSTCQYVPEEIRSYALKSARSIIESDSGRRTHQARGQLMGNLLSFPFLCLTNYLSFKSIVRRKVPLRINGDDIVFRATPEEAELWCKGVGESGLTLSRGKTLIDRQYFSLNSTFFRASSSRCRFVPIIRSKALFKKPDSLSSLVGQYGGCVVGGSSEFRNGVRRLFLRQHMTMVYRSRRSLTRGLGLRASIKMLKSADLWDREKFYLSLAVEEPIPVPPSQVLWGSQPAGWRQLNLLDFSREQRDVLRRDETRFFSILTTLAWNRPSKIFDDNSMKTCWDTYWERVQGSTYRYVPGRFRRLQKAIIRDTLDGVDLLPPRQRFARFLARDDEKYHRLMKVQHRELCWVDMGSKAREGLLMRSASGKCFSVEAPMKEQAVGSSVEDGGVAL